MFLFPPKTLKKIAVQGDHRETLDADGLLNLPKRYTNRARLVTT